MLAQMSYSNSMLTYHKQRILSYHNDNIVFIILQHFAVKLKLQKIQSSFCFLRNYLDAENLLIRNGDRGGP